MDRDTFDFINLLICVAFLFAAMGSYAYVEKYKTNEVGFLFTRI